MVDFFYELAPESKEEKFLMIDESWVNIADSNLTIPANDNIVRLTPPLIITNDEVDQAIEIINNVIKGIDD